MIKNPTSKKKRIQLPVQGIQVWSLFREIRSTCWGATKPWVSSTEPKHSVVLTIKLEKSMPQWISSIVKTEKEKRNQPAFLSLFSRKLQGELSCPTSTLRMRGEKISLKNSKQRTSPQIYSLKLPNLIVWKPQVKSKDPNHKAKVKCKLSPKECTFNTIYKYI